MLYLGGGERSNVDNIIDIVYDKKIEELEKEYGTRLKKIIPNGSAVNWAGVTHYFDNGIEEFSTRKDPEYFYIIKINNQWYQLRTVYDTSPQLWSDFYNMGYDEYPIQAYNLFTEKQEYETTTQMSVNIFQDDSKTPPEMTFVPDGGDIDLASFSWKKA